MICTSWHQLDVRCYVNFKVQKFCFEKILYIWLEKRRWCVVSLKVFCKSKYRFSANLLRGFLPSCWREFLKIPRWCYAKILRLISKKYYEVFFKILRCVFAKILKVVMKIYCEVFCRSTEKFSAKIPKGVLKNYCHVVCKNSERCSAKILRVVLQKHWKLFCKIAKESSTIYKLAWCSVYHYYCTTSFIKAWNQVLSRLKFCSRRVGDSPGWGPLMMVPSKSEAKRLLLDNHTTKKKQKNRTIWKKINRFLVKTQGIGLLPVTLWPTILGGQKIISNYWERCHLQIFDVH